MKNLYCDDIFEVLVDVGLLFLYYFVGWDMCPGDG